MVLHTWSQTLEHHIHVHCVVTGGALVLRFRIDAQVMLPPPDR
jgi:Putative transposase